MTADQALADAKQHLAPRRIAWPWGVVFIGLAGLGVTNVLLVRANTHLQDQITDSRADRDRQFTALSGKVDDLNGQVDDLSSRLQTAQQQAAVKDARIRQLTDALLAAGVPVPPPTVIIVPQPSASSRPTPTPTPTPGPPSPSPRPTTRTPTPTPSPTSTCLLGLICPRSLP